jgi:hypothetical protein
MLPLSCAPPIYDELSTTAKAMYELGTIIETREHLSIFGKGMRILPTV